MAKQTQGTMLMVGALAGTVGFVAFVALMIVGEYTFSPALFLAGFIAVAVAVVLFIGLHGKQRSSEDIVTNAPVPSADPPSTRAPKVGSHSLDQGSHAEGASGSHGADGTSAMTPSAMAAAAPDAGSDRAASDMAPAPDPETSAATLEDAPDHAPAGANGHHGPSDKPETLDAPRAGGPDDLKMIKGVGPKLEEMCHGLGFYHFDQIAAWSPSEVAWVDENLEGFKGRVSRDDWVVQAKALAAGEQTEFSKKVDDGKVY